MKKLSLKIEGIGTMLDKGQMKRIVGGYGEPGCCSIYCFDSNYFYYGAVSYNNNCDGPWLDVCRHFWPTATVSGCQCS